MKRCLTIFLTLSLILTILPVPARTEGVYVAASTPLGDSAARISNIRLAAEAINGVFVPYGGSFSFNDTVGARTAERGYQSALNGRGAKVVGGGVAQAASAVWLAVKDMADIAIVEKSTYGNRYSQNYVSSSADAILVDYNAGTDFSFRYTGAGSIAIHLTLDGDTLTCRVTGGAGADDAPTFSDDPVWW